ncbi:hypothetical protein CLD22_19475 [Rubrivivax gelatinosus]|nr:hypothetical protein [Rubrivivax gelatinosus]
MLRSSLSTALSLSCLTLAACGGGGGDETQDDPKARAAIETVAQNPACAQDTLGSYYWELGDRDGRLVSGRVGSLAPNSDTSLKIASASKWIYAAYVAQKRGGTLDPEADVPYLNFTSGYSRFSTPTCPGSDGTVADCLDGERGEQNPATVGKFDYNSGHMQRHAASAMGLGSLKRDALASEVSSVLGVTVDYFEVQLAASAEMTPEAYARFLRKILGGDLKIGSLLGHDARCASESACPETVVHSPQQTLDWHYALGHWVEDDAGTAGDANVAYSSAGALGFYPWINEQKTLYGIVARQEAASSEQEGFKSALCGAAIRRAYASATVQTGN